MQNVVLCNRGLPLIVRALNAAEKNMGAIPTTGNGLALMIPHGRSKATAGTKAQIATMRRMRCGSACWGDSLVWSKAIGRCWRVEMLLVLRC
jgi:hypothetical protein